VGGHVRAQVSFGLSAGNVAGQKRARTVTLAAFHLRTADNDAPLRRHTLALLNNFANNAIYVSKLQFKQNVRRPAG
jgi:hypothetical protein